MTQREPSQDPESGEPDVLRDAEGDPVENPTVSGILPPIPDQGGVPSLGDPDPGLAGRQAVHPPYPEEAVGPAEPVAQEPEAPAAEPATPEPEPPASEPEPVPPYAEEPMAEPDLMPEPVAEPSPAPEPEPASEPEPEPEPAWDPEPALAPEPVTSESVDDVPPVNDVPPLPDFLPEPDLVAEAASAEPAPEPGWDTAPPPEPVPETVEPPRSFERGPATAPEVSIPQPQSMSEPDQTGGTAGPFSSLRAAASDLAAKSSSRPEILVGAACAGGLVLALLIRRVGSR